MDEQNFLPKSIIGQAATYARNQCTALNRYLEDGELSIDNNAAERTMKAVAIGRKNWLFVGSPEAGARAAVMMSLIASCKANEVEPWACLNDVLTQIPAGASPRIPSPRHLAPVTPQTSLGNPQTKTQRTTQKMLPVVHLALIHELEFEDLFSNLLLTCFKTVADTSCYLLCLLIHL
ncbi:MAG: transposase [Planctomycetaceae bacterium]